MQERYFPNPPTFFRNASDIVNKCKSGVSRTRRLAIALHLFPGELYGRERADAATYPLTRTSMYFSSGPRRRLGGAYMLVRAGALGPLFLKEAIGFPKETMQQLELFLGGAEPPV